MCIQSIYTRVSRAGRCWHVVKNRHRVPCPLCCARRAHRKSMKFNLVVNRNNITTIATTTTTATGWGQQTNEGTAHTLMAIPPVVVCCCTKETT